MRYFKRHWNEGRGDELDAWGPATYFLEARPNGSVTRQVEVYSDGHVLAYDELLLEDRFGGLADQPLDLDTVAGFEVDQATFEAAWSVTPSNCRVSRPGDSKAVFHRMHSHEPTNWRCGNCQALFGRLPPWCLVCGARPAP